ncbi:response regulator [Ramlibacter albus]|uniref:Response regulator n=1 Tax=Ramlibacter albus TaxID=2079448 RepID=A0A923S499_9BURK|nr:response regulator [Ramlibacter albus]
MTIEMVMVEDSREIISAIEDLLAPDGRFRIVGRNATENEATAWLQEHPHDWDLAVIDLVLRDGSGFNVVRRYREANETARIVVLSDYATLNIKLRCVELGADAVFTKGEFKAFIAYVSSIRPRGASLHA